MEITLFLGIGTYSKLFKFMLRQVFVFLFFVTLFILFDESASALNLFSNPGFEDGISSWTLNGTTATFSAVTEQKRSGSYAAKLSKENSSSWAYFYDSGSNVANLWYI